MEPCLSAGVHNLSPVRAYNEGFCLALDIVFLLYLALGRRRNELHAISCDVK